MLVSRILGEKVLMVGFYFECILCLLRSVQPPIYDNFSGDSVLRIFYFYRAGEIELLIILYFFVDLGSLIGRARCSLLLRITNNIIYFISDL